MSDLEEALVLADHTRYAVRLRYAGADSGAKPPDRCEAIGRVEALSGEVWRQLTTVEGN